MRRSALLLTAAVAALSACGQSDDGAANQASKPAPKKRPPHCFFKDDELKDWTASRDKDGNVTIKLKAHVQDPRYKAVVGQVAVGPKKVIIFPSITNNDTGYAAVDDWWDLTETAPNTAALTEAAVQCGDKTFADLQVPPKS